MNPSWDILISSIEHRADMLDALLDELERQLQPGVGVRVFRDNLDVVYGTKCQRLLESSQADYVSFLDDDDWVEPDFVAAIMDALEQRPDYVGFNVRYTIDGKPATPVYHTTTRGPGWHTMPDALYRDINHFNPIRRAIALEGVWQGGNGADAAWAEQIRNTGLVQHEVYIDRELHHYRFRWSQTFTRSSGQEPLTEHPPWPAHKFVEWVD